MPAGRPAQFRNAAEKQKAYRERKKQADRDAELAFMLLDDMRCAEKALRNLMEYHTRRGESVDLEYHPDGEGGFCVMKAGGYWRHNVDMFLVRCLLRAGVLIEVRKDVHGRHLAFVEETVI